MNFFPEIFLKNDSINIAMQNSFFSARIHSFNPLYTVCWDFVYDLSHEYKKTENQKPHKHCQC